MFFSYLCTGWRERKEKTQTNVLFFLPAHLCNNQLIVAHLWKEEDGEANYSEAMDTNYIQGQIICIILL